MLAPGQARSPISNLSTDATRERRALRRHTQDPPLATGGPRLCAPSESLGRGTVASRASLPVAFGAACAACGGVGFAAAFRGAFAAAFRTAAFRACFMSAFRTGGAALPSGAAFLRALDQSGFFRRTSWLWRRSRREIEMDGRLKRHSSPSLKSIRCSSSL